jgi:hypothetical protein
MGPHWTNDSVGERTEQIFGQTLARGPTEAVETTALTKKSPLIGLNVSVLVWSFQSDSNALASREGLDYHL